MNGLIAAYIAWIIAQTGLSVPDYPSIHLVTPTEMAMRYGRPQNSGRELQALYNRNEGAIYLPQAWLPDDLRQNIELTTACRWNSATTAATYSSEECGRVNWLTSVGTSIHGSLTFYRDRFAAKCSSKQKRNDRCPAREHRSL